jgi:protein-tyrosine phosphatase
MAASPDRALSVCFVCLGNICRSPTAEGVMKRLVHDAGLNDRVRVASAGTGAWHLDEPADARARATAHARGVALDGRAKQFAADDFPRFDYILSMDARVLRMLSELARTDADRARVRNFRSFDPESPADAEVPDPYYGGADGFERVFDICEAGCRGLLEQLRRDLAGDWP